MRFKRQDELDVHDGHGTLIVYDATGDIRHMQPLRLTWGDDVISNDGYNWGPPEPTTVHFDTDDPWVIGQVILETPIGCYEYEVFRDLPVDANVTVEFTIGTCGPSDHQAKGMPTPCKVRIPRRSQDAVGSSRDESKLGGRTGPTPAGAVEEVGQGDPSEGREHGGGDRGSGAG